MYQTINHHPMTNEQIIEKAPAAGAITPMSTVSNRYSFVPTIKVVDILRDCGWMPIFAQQARANKEEREGYQKHLIRFQYDGLQITNQERVDLVLYNSHDRGCAFNLIASIWRKICGNGLMVSSDLVNFQHKHMGFDSNELASSAITIAGSAGEIANQVEDLKTIELTQDERGVFATAAHQLVYKEPENAPIVPARLLKERRYDDNGKDLWTTFNVIQENIMKGGLSSYVRKSNGRMGRKSTRTVKSIDRNVKLNKALWILTEQMAELKKAA